MDHRPNPLPVTAAQIAEFDAAVASPAFSHARYRERCYVGVVHVYHRNADSPSGVLLAAGLCNEPIADAILAAHGRTSALSPTEGLRGDLATFPR